MKTLEAKIKKSQEVIKEVCNKFSQEKIALAWTAGKDSTVLVHLIRETFTGVVPFPVLFNDSTMEFPEVYDFINEWSKKWRLNLVTVKHDPKELAEFHRSGPERQKELSRLMKITAIKNALEVHGFKAYVVGIRWDEHEARSKEKYFSPRKDHTRIHPILHFTEEDIWNYIKRFRVPYLSLYNQGYRSIGEAPFTRPAKKGEGERSGREHDKEAIMKRLRELGYW